jgi:Fanconi anemia group M protein
MSEYVNHPLIKPGKVEARLYQQVIAAEACSRNTLVVLPTALGKTVIAVMVAAHVLHRFPWLKVLMLAPTRPLVLQHRDSFAKFLAISEDELLAVTGRFPPATRRALWSRGRIFFATPQVVKNDIEAGILDLSQFSLIIFDEAHRGVKKYAYTDIAKVYVESNSYPLILALTASPGGKRERLDQVCRALFIEKVVYKSESDPDVMPFIPGIRVEWRLVELPGEYGKAEEVLREMIQQRVSRLIKAGHIAKSASQVSKSDLLEAGKKLQEALEQAGRNEKGAIFQAIVFQSAALSLAHALEVLQTQGAAQALNFVEKLARESDEKRSYSNIISDELFPYLRSTLRRAATVEHPKTEALVEIVDEQLRRSPGSKVLIFTQIRDTATRIVESLRREGIACERFVGQASKGDDRGMTQEEQRDVIRRFRAGEFRVLVATSIAEEGLDIPNVDMVVFYEPVPSEIRFIQRRGRTGRKAPGKVVILAAKGTADMAYLHSSRRKERAMKVMLAKLNAELKPLERGRPPEPPADFRDVIMHESTSIEDTATPTGETKNNTGIISAGAENPLQRCLDEWLPSGEVHGVGRAEKAVLHVLAEKRRLAVDELIEVLTQNGTLTVDQVKAAIHGLLAKKEIYVPKVGEVALPEAEGENIYDAVVERVYPGGATLLLNGRFRARLDEADFPEASGMLKKGARLRIRGRLYRLNGVLHVRPVEVLP